jgi:hypothetical protein
METLSHTMIGRIIQVMNPDLVNEIVEQYTPLSKDPAMVALAYKTVKIHFPDMDDLDQKLMFIGIVYIIFIPGSFLPPRVCQGQRTVQAQAKLPKGIRNEIARCVGMKYPEEVNRLKHYIEPWTKNPRYRAKMKLVTDAMGLTKSKES